MGNNEWEEIPCEVEAHIREGIIYAKFANETSLEAGDTIMMHVTSGLINQFKVSLWLKRKAKEG